MGRKTGERSKRYDDAENKGENAGITQDDDDLLINSQDRITEIVYHWVLATRLLQDLFASQEFSHPSVVVQDMGRFLREKCQYLPELLRDAMDVR